MYAAISQGFFKEEGLNIELSTGQGADKTMQEVIEMDINEFKRVAKRAYETATSTFSRDTWAEKWITMINFVMSSKW